MLMLLRDLLLESPIPSSNWMPTRSQRLAEAPQVIRRRFGSGSGFRRPSARLRDIAPTHLPIGGARYVSGDLIEAEVQAEITAIDAPVVQGWAWLLLLPVFVVMVIGLGLLERDAPERGVALVVVGPLAWGAIVWAWGVSQWEVSLTEGGVAVCHWSDVRRGHRGRRIGPPEVVTAQMIGHTLVLAGPDGRAAIHLGLWPPSAIADLHDKLPVWGVGGPGFAEPGHHHRHERRHHRRRRG